MLKQYIRDKNNRRVGVLVALNMGLSSPEDKMFLVGVSRCAPQDKFDPEYGTKMAEDRAVKWYQRGLTPQGLEDVLMSFSGPMFTEFWEFVSRCKKYYKDCAPAPYLTTALAE